VLERARMLRVRFHDLRHTAASLMLNAGIPLIEVSRRLGHSRASITLDIYGHLIPSMHIDTAERIDELFTPTEVSEISPDLHPNLYPEIVHPHI
jgi:integrase